VGASTGTQPPAAPPSLALYQMAVGHYFSRALCLAVKLGLADLLKDDARHYSDLAAATETHAPSLNRMLRLLASAGVFVEHDGGKFALAPLGQYLRADVPGSVRFTMLLFAGDGVQDAWRELEYCVRTGNPAFKRNAPDATPFSQIDQNPQMAAVFDEAMATFAPMTAAAMAATYDFSSFRTLIDLGGGNGAIMIGILKACPQLRGIVFDRPNAAARARDKIAEAGLSARCEVVGGDFFESVPRGGDAYLLKHVIHDWDDERAMAILTNCRRAMNAQSKLLIAEGVYPPRIDQSDLSRGAAANDLNMLVATGGRARSESEFRALYAAAGFRLTRIVPTPARLSVIEGVPVAG
jgi:orsellinic acid C2-O-methyltransferase